MTTVHLFCLTHLHVVFAAEDRYEVHNANCDRHGRPCGLGPKVSLVGVVGPLKMCVERFKERGSRHLKELTDCQAFAVDIFGGVEHAFLRKAWEAKDWRRLEKNRIEID